VVTPRYRCNVELSGWYQWWKQRGSLELRELLLSEWDPIGVRDADGPDDEYDGYLGQLGGLLRQGLDVGTIAEYLASAEHHMGFDTQPDQPQKVAEHILDWYDGAME
jgi:hypothetical protein